MHFSYSFLCRSTFSDMKNVQTNDIDLFIIASDGVKVRLENDKDLRYHLDSARRYPDDRPPYFEFRLGNTEIDNDAPAIRMTSNPLL